MNQDALTRAMEALRTTADGSSEDASVSRRRILARTQGSRPKRRLAIVLLPLAATLLVSSAWGAASGRLPRWVRALTESLSLGTGDFSDKRTDVERATPTTKSPTLATPIAMPEPHDVPAHPTRTSAGSSSKNVASEKPIPSKPLASSISAAERAAYDEAHTAHFVRHDAAAAVSAWDAYLSEFPTGVFALEARYNRAISLARVGRHQEARAALEPFASGSLGGYRQTEARTLLDALTDSRAH